MRRWKTQGAIVGFAVIVALAMLVTAGRPAASSNAPANLTTALIPGDFVSFTCAHGQVTLSGSSVCHDQTDVLVGVSGGGVASYTMKAILDPGYAFSSWSSSGDSCLGTYPTCNSASSANPTPYWGYCAQGERCGGTLTMATTSVSGPVTTINGNWGTVGLTYPLTYTAATTGGTSNGALIYYANCVSETNCAGTTGQTFNPAGDWSATFPGATPGTYYWAVKDVTTGVLSNWVTVVVTQDLVTEVQSSVGPVPLAYEEGYTVTVSGGTLSGALTYYPACSVPSTTSCAGIPGQTFTSAGDWTYTSAGQTAGTWYWAVEDMATDVVSNWVEIQVSPQNLGLTINGLTGTVDVSPGAQITVSATGGTPSAALTYYPNCATESISSCAGTTGQSFSSAGDWSGTFTAPSSGTWYWAVVDDSTSSVSNWVTLTIT